MLQFQAVHFWHADVENQARDFLDIAGAEEFVRRGEGLGLKTKRMNQVSRSHYVVVKFLLQGYAEKPYAICGIATTSRY